MIAFFGRKSTLWALGFALLLEAALLLRPLPVRSFDCRLYYFPGEIAGILGAFGEAGRKAYVVNEWIDFGFLMTYSGLLVGILGRRTPGFPTILMALAPGIFDFLETGGVLRLLYSFPDAHPEIGALISICTPLKWLAWIVVAGLLIQSIRQYFRSSLCAQRARSSRCCRGH